MGELCDPGRRKGVNWRTFRPGKIITYSDSASRQKRAKRFRPWRKSTPSLPDIGKTHERLEQSTKNAETPEPPANRVCEWTMQQRQRVFAVQDQQLARDCILQPLHSLRELCFLERIVVRFPRPPVPTKLDPYKGIITARLDARTVHLSTLQMSSSDADTRRVLRRSPLRILSDTLPWFTNASSMFSVCEADTVDLGHSGSLGVCAAETVRQL